MEVEKRGSHSEIVKSHRVASLILAALLLFVRCSLGANLAPNPGFEEAGPDGVPVGWHQWGGSPTPMTAQRDADRPHSGKFCLRVTNDAGDHNYYASSDYLPIDPKQQYLLTVWVRASKDRRVRFRFDMLDANKKYLGAESAVAGVGKEWRHVGLVAAHLHDTAAFAQVSLEAGTGETGTAWYDDAELTALAEGVRNHVIAPDPAKWKPFPIPWRDTGATATDMSVLLDGPTGKHGYLTTRPDGHFYFQDGTRARFWATNVHSSNALFPTHEEAETFAARLARQGVNMVRTHLLEYDAPGGLIDPNRNDSQHFSTEQLEKFDYLLYQFHRHGIYIIPDALPMCARKFRPGDDLPEEIKTLGLGAPIVSYFDPQVINLAQKYARDFFGHFNPYTKKRYCDDPTIALVEMTNENTLFLLGYWWGELPPYYRRELQTLWNVWLKKRYTSRDALSKAWQRADGKGVLMKEEDLSPGTVLAPARPEYSEFGERGADWARFLAELQRRYQADMHTFLRSLGVKVPITASNSVSHPLGQATYDVLDFTDHHVYWDHPRYEKGMESSILNQPMVKADPVETQTLINGLSVVKVAGQPCVLTEWNSLWPNQFRAADVLSTTAYACLQDWDAMYIYCYRGGWGQRYGQWDDMIPHATVIFADPAQAGLFPACAAMFLRHDVSAARRLVELAYGEHELVHPELRRADPHRFIPYLSRIQRRFKGEPGQEVTVTIPLTTAGRGRVWNLPPETPCESAAALFTEYMRRLGLYKQDQGWLGDGARSDTGELYTSWKDGITTIDTPRTQSASGFLGDIKRAVRLHDVTFECHTDFATLTLTSLDGKPIVGSSHLLLTAIGRAGNTGQQLERTSLPSELTVSADIAVGGSVHVASGGTAPVLIEPIEAIVTLHHRATGASPLQVFALDPSGKRMRPVPVETQGNALRLTIGGQWATMYYELTRAES